ncbi:MAG: hypothetical protein FWF59_03205 [Turicibacter sp.]|nr:hypothetical protein [Turicibacter sp.]
MKGISIDVLNEVENLLEWELVLKAITSRQLALEIDLTQALKDKDAGRQQELNQKLTQSLITREKIEAFLGDHDPKASDFIKDFPWDGLDVELLIYALAEFSIEVMELKNGFLASSMHQAYTDKLQTLETRLQQLRDEVSKITP